MAASSPPRAKKESHIWSRPSGQVEDNYAWMKDKTNPDLLSYLNAENEYCENYLSERRDLIDSIYSEIKDRTLETDNSVPVKKGTFYYTSKTEEGKQYRVYSRGPSRSTATDQILFDENEAAKGHPFFDLGIFDVSPDEKWLAYSVDIEGSELYTIHFRNLETMAELEEEIQRTYYGGGAWSLDSKYFFYIIQNEQMRPYQLWRHKIGTSTKMDTLIYTENDEKFYIGVSLSRSLSYIFLHSASITTSETWFILSEDPLSPLVCMRERVSGVEYSVGHWGDCFVILTNENAEDFCLMKAGFSFPSFPSFVRELNSVSEVNKTEDWAPFIPHSPGERIVRFECFKSHLLVLDWSQAQQRVRVIFKKDEEKEKIKELKFGDEPHRLSLYSNDDWEAASAIIQFESLTTPNSIFEHHLDTNARELLKQRPVIGVDFSRYTASRVWAPSHDQTLVPIDLVHLKDRKEGEHPLMLYGYGAYEVSTGPWFSIARLSLLDRGFVWALTHPRGGGELGRKWYNEGKMLKKKNTFYDFKACAEYLIKTKWTSPDKLIIRGASAGGLLVGATLVMNPELYRGVIAEVPFVDVWASMSDSSLPLTITEWEEWGDPREEPFCSYMESYSPYDNTKEGVIYPSMFVTAGLSDPRVCVHEPAKWVARLREIRDKEKPKRDREAPLLLKTEMSAGHLGPSGRYNEWKTEAEVLAYALSLVSS